MGSGDDINRYKVVGVGEELSLFLAFIEILACTRSNHTGGGDCNLL